MGSALDELKRVPMWGWLIVGVIVVGVIVAVRKGRSSTTSQLGSAATPQPADLSGLTATDTTQGNAALQELMSIDKSLSEIGQSSPTTSSIYTPGTVGNNFHPLGSLQEALNAVASGIPVYYQPSPGEFAIVPPSNIFAGSGYDHLYINIPGMPASPNPVTTYPQTGFPSVAPAPALAPSRWGP